MSAADSFEAVEQHLTEVREDTRRNLIALLVVVTVGIAAAWVHWSGLLAAGILIGIVSRSLRMAVATAVGFGVVVMIVFALTEGTAVFGYHELAPIIYVTVGSAFALPILGSLVRGLV